MNRKPRERVIPMFWKDMAKRFFSASKVFSLQRWWQTVFYYVFGIEMKEKAFTARLTSIINGVM